jgi:serine/threonine protein kinase
MATNRKTNQRVAIKIYEKIKLLDPEKLKNVKNEIDILRQLEHPNIIRLLQEFETFRQIHIVMEYIGTTSLGEFLKKRPGKKLPENEARLLFQQLASAIDCLHKSSMVHRDIKADNVLIESLSCVKLIDFGFASKPSENSTGILCGTPAYMAPEIVCKSEEQTSFPVDIWALGVLLFQTVEGDLPFKGGSDREVFQKIKTGKYDANPSWSANLRDLIASMLKLEPSQRATSGDVQISSWPYFGF